MSREVLRDVNGETTGFFNPETSQEYDEGSVWNGSNHISLATGSQWDHEKLYKTKKGSWVLWHFSSWQGVLDRYEEIDEANALVWLLKNGHIEEAEAISPEFIEAHEV